MKFRILAAAAALSVVSAMPAQAATYIVDAQANSSGGSGVGLSTVALTVGKVFKISSSLNDLWSAGALPRYSDANGLVGPRLATAADDSGQPVGSQIGADFGQWSQGNLSAAYGSLVGQIDNGDFFLLGANGTFAATTAGTLKLFYWDSNSSDNFGDIRFSVSVPEAATWAMMIAGFGFIGAAMRRTRSRKVSFA